MRCVRPGRIAGRRQGLSLMEVIVAIAVLGGALTVIGNLVYMGSRSASKSKWLSEGQIICDTKMAEISGGVLPLENNGGSSVPENPDWVYSVAIQSSDLTGLLSVTVMVQAAPSVDTALPPFTLTRLIPDPDYDPEQSVVQ